MKASELEPIISRKPFQPFGIRLSSGSEYHFMEPRQIGSPRQPRNTIFYFDEDGWALIDVESITEIFNP